MVEIERLSEEQRKASKDQLKGRSTKAINCIIWRHG